LGGSGVKEIDEITIPDDRRYSRDHEWAKPAGDTVRVGITDYAQDQLGDVVFVELPEEGAEFEKGEVFGCVESVKAVSDLFLPVGGAVAEVNRALEGSPQLVNENAYEEGWMIAVAPNTPDELEELLSHADYREMLKEIE
jgi:glycine cleavage system H protein